MTWVDCLPDKQLTTNFRSGEFACHCGLCSGGKVFMSHVLRLQRLREELGEAITVLSGFRCADHNRREGGAVDSLHLRGLASDVHVAPMTGNMRYRIVKLAIELGFKGIGIRSGGIHLDERETPMVWTYGDK